MTHLLGELSDSCLRKRKRRTRPTNRRLDGRTTGYSLVACPMSLPCSERAKKIGAGSSMHEHDAAVARQSESREGPSRNMVEALRDGIRQEMVRDPGVVVLGEDVGRKGGVFKVTEGLQTEFGALRVLDAPISEVVIAGAAIGAAMMGLRP